MLCLRTASDKCINNNLLLTAHVGVVKDWFAPHAAAIVLVGANSKLVRGVGFQVVDDRVARWTGLIIPLPVPLPIADGVKTVDTRRVTCYAIIPEFLLSKYRSQNVIGFSCSSHLHGHRECRMWCHVGFKELRINVRIIGHPDLGQPRVESTMQSRSPTFNEHIQPI